MTANHIFKEGLDIQDGSINNICYKTQSHIYLNLVVLS